MESLIKDIKPDEVKYKIYLAISEHHTTKNRYNEYAGEFSSTMESKYQKTIQEIMDFAKDQKRKLDLGEEIGGEDVDDLFEDHLKEKDKDSEEDEDPESEEDESESESEDEFEQPEKTPIEQLSDDLMMILYKKLSRKLHPDKCRNNPELSKYQEVVNKAKEHSDLIKVLAVAYFIKIPLDDVDLDFYSDAIDHNIHIMRMRTENMKNASIWRWKYATNIEKESMENTYLHQMHAQAANGIIPKTCVAEAQ